MEVSENPVRGINSKKLNSSKAMVVKRRTWCKILKPVFKGVSLSDEDDGVSRAVTHEQR